MFALFNGVHEKNFRWSVIFFELIIQSINVWKTVLKYAMLLYCPVDEIKEVIRVQWC